METILKTIAVIDGDIVAYRCAAANETRSIKATHKITGQEIICPHRTAFKEQIKGVFEIEEFTIEDVQESGNIILAKKAIDAVINSLKRACNADEVEVYLSGVDNFRDGLPLPSKYKGTRSSIKPLQLKHCRSYLEREIGATVINGREVDDMLAQRCYEGLQQKIKTIACTLDGDQNGVSGWMYNWNKHKEPALIKGLGNIYLVNGNKDFDGQGRKFFYAQWVLGDVVDAFKPCEISGKKFGVMGMYNLLSKCTTDKECVEAIYKQYKSWYPQEFIEYTDFNGVQQKKTLIELMNMYAACAHMRRFEDDVFDTAKLLTTLGIEK